jgi:ketosteroid isomerase-like protein
MSQENVELVLSLYEAVQRQDYESPFEVVDEDILWDMSGFDLPDMAKVYRGHDGIREFWGRWLAAWETVEFKALDVEDHGDRVVVDVEQRNRGRGSGVAVDFHYFQISTVRDGKVTASRMARTKAEALEAADLAE